MMNAFIQSDNGFIMVHKFYYKQSYRMLTDNILDVFWTHRQILHLPF